MPNVSPEVAEDACRRILQAEGVPPDDAAIVAMHLVDSSLHGHDSHGAGRLGMYVQRMRDGVIAPGATIEFLDETETTFRVDGHRNFGFVAARRAMERVIQKAKRVNMASAVVFNEDHTGRIGLYTLMAAREGLIGMMANSTTMITNLECDCKGREVSHVSQ